MFRAPKHFSVWYKCFPDILETYSASQKKIQMKKLRHGEENKT